jgi:hypothetical protein
MDAHNPLRVKYFHEALAGNVHEYLLKSSIGKASNILVHVFRKRKADFEDDAIGICAGLWNFVLSY